MLMDTMFGKYTQIYSIISKLAVHAKYHTISMTLTCNNLDWLWRWWDGGGGEETIWPWAKANNDCIWRQLVSPNPVTSKDRSNLFQFGSLSYLSLQMSLESWYLYVMIRTLNFIKLDEENTSSGKVNDKDIIRILRSFQFDLMLHCWNLLLSPSKLS